MLKESVLGKIFYFIISLIKYIRFSKAWEVLGIIKNKISRVFYNSNLYLFLFEEDKLKSATAKSGILLFLDKMSENFLSILKSMYEKLKSINCSSINSKICKRIASLKYVSFINFMGLVFVITALVPGEKWNNLYGFVMSLGVFFCYFVLLVSGRKFSYHISKADIIMLFFMLSVALAVFISYDVKDSFRVFLFFVTSFMLYISVKGSVKSEKDLDKVVMFLTAGLLLTSLYCIYQGITGVEIDARLIDMSSSNISGRAYSTFENPNNYAEYLVLLIPFMGAFFLTREKKWQKMGLVLILIPVVALVYTYSRSCWVSFAISVAVFVCFYNYRLIPVILLLGIACIPFLPASVMHRISTIGSMKDSSNKYRVYIWEGSLRMLKKIWITGIGLGPEAFRKIYPSFAEPTAASAPHSHMVFLEIFIETGIIGFISFCSYWFFTLKRLVTAKIRYEISDKLRVYICAALASFTGVIFVSGVEYIWFYPRVMFTFFTIAGLIGAIIKLADKNKTKEKKEI